MTIIEAIKQVGGGYEGRVSHGHDRAHSTFQETEGQALYDAIWWDAEREPDARVRAALRTKVKGRS